MNYKKNDLSKAPKEIFESVINNCESQLLIPPDYQNQEMTIENPESEKKMIGLFSSGTTAKRKCIWNSFENLKLNALRSATAFNMSSDDRLLIIAKPWHVAGLSWAIMAEELGCDYHFVTSKKGESKLWLKAVREYKPDYLLTVPPVFRSIYDEKWEVENIVTGGIPLKFEDFESLKNHCQKVHQGYGQTEAGGLISVHSFKSDKEPDFSEHLNCGKPIKGVEIKTEGTPDDPDLIFLKSDTAYTSKQYNSGDIGFFKNDEIHLVGRSRKVISEKS